MGIFRHDLARPGRAPGPVRDDKALVTAADVGDRDGAAVLLAASARSSRG